MPARRNQTGLPFPDERRFTRQVVSLHATVRELGGAPLTATVSNISRNGCELVGCNLEQRAEIWVQISGYGPVRATVIWSKQNRAGCEFYMEPSPERGRSDRW